MSTSSSAETLCARIADRLADNVGQWRYRMFFPSAAKLQLKQASPPQLQIQVPNHFVADRIGRGLVSELKEAAAGETGEQVTLEFAVCPELFEPQSETTDASASAPGAADKWAGPAQTARPAAAAPRLTRPRNKGIALRHDLKEFIVGPSNELAFAAVSSFASEDEHACHTVFLHGGCGLGKTHLLQGACKAFQKQHPEARIMYCTGEHFTNEFLAHVRSNRIEVFRKQIRRLDLLAIDDVNFIADKRATQREFLHCFDALELRGSRVMIANDSPPRQIEQFSEALQSRCARGMVVQIHEPNSQTRQKIIQSIAVRRGMVLNEGAVQLLAARCIRSIREIEGALTKLHALSRLGDQRHDVIGPSLVHRLFSSELLDAPRRAVTFNDIVESACQTLGVEPERIFSKSRHRDVVLVRSIVVHLTREMTKMSFPEIGKAMKRSNHSTIVTAAQRIEKQLAANHVAANPANGQLTPLAELIERARQSVQLH